MINWILVVEVRHSIGLPVITLLIAYIIENPNSGPSAFSFNQGLERLDKAYVFIGQSSDRHSSRVKKYMLLIE